MSTHKNIISPHFHIKLYTMLIKNLDNQKIIVPYFEIRIF